VVCAVLLFSAIGLAVLGLVLHRSNESMFDDTDDE